MASRPTRNSPDPPQREPRLVPVRVVVVVYVVAAVLWILGSSPLADVFTHVTAIPRWVVEIGKGVLFVAVTGVVLQVVLQRREDRQDATEARTQDRTRQLAASEGHTRLQAAALSSTASAVRRSTGICGTRSSPDGCGTARSSTAAGTVSSTRSARPSRPWPRRRVRSSTSWRSTRTSPHGSGRNISWRPAGCNYRPCSTTPWMRSCSPTIRVLGATLSVAVEGRFTAFVDTGTESGTFALRHRDGHVVQTEYRAVSNIQPGVHLSVLRDVTARYEMLRALTLAETAFRELAEPG